MTEAVEAKIEKLLRMADGNANENESANALRLAQALADAHNLDLGQIGKTGSRRDEQISKGLYTYQRTLYTKLAELNHCRVWISKGVAKGSKYQTRLLGSKINVTAVKIMADYVEEVANRLAKERYGAQGYFTRPAHIFREGFVDKMVERITERREAEEKAREVAKREQDARSRHPGAATENTIILITDVAREEEKANYDYLHGEGAWDRIEDKKLQYAQEHERRMAVARESRERAEREYEAWAIANPEAAAEKAKRQREEAEAQRIKNEKQWAKWAREYDRAEARREKAREERIRRYGYDPEDYKMSKDEKKRSNPAYRAGRSQAEHINLDDQIKEEKRKALS